MQIESCRIVQRVSHVTGSNRGSQPEWHKDGRPYSEVFIRADGRDFYTRLFHPIDNTPHARSAQIQAFLARMEAARRVEADASRR